GGCRAGPAARGGPGRRRAGGGGRGGGCCRRPRGRPSPPPPWPPPRGAQPASLVGAEVLLRYSINVRPALIWYPPAFGLLVLALTGVLRGWPWPLRLVLHAAWLAGVGVLAAKWVS